MTEAKILFLVPFSEKFSSKGRNEAFFRHKVSSPIFLFIYYAECLNFASAISLISAS